MMTNVPTSADFVFRNGRVYTVNAQQAWAEAVAVTADKIVFVGSNTEVSAYIGERTQVFDLGQKIVLPGFIDAHAHPIVAAAFGSCISIKDNSSVEAVLSQIRRYIAAYPDKQAYLGFGWENSLFSTRGPTKEVLDAILPEKPIVLLSNDAHTGWMNSAALQKMSFANDVPDHVANGGEFFRDGNGNLTGVSNAAATSMVVKKLRLMAAPDMAAGTEKMIQQMSRYGITSIFDAGLLNCPIVDAYKLLHSMVLTDELPFRYFGSYGVMNNKEISGAVDKLALLAKKYNSDRLRVNTLKLVLDGTVESRTAAFFEPYLDTGFASDIIFDKKLVRETVLDAVARGFDIHLHAIGDRAVCEALEIATIVREAGYNDARITVCHAQVWRDEDRKKFKDTNVFVNFTGSWIYPDENVKTAISERLYNQQFRYRVLANDGVVITQGSDYPAAETVNPLENIEMSHTRMQVAETAGEHEALVPLAESLPLEMAIKTYTIHAARQLGMENSLGSIEVGKYADIIVMEKNIFELNPYEIHSVMPSLVMMAGKIRFAGGVVKIMDRKNPFDEQVDLYETWFVENRHIFLSEVAAIKQILPATGKGLEIGVGTGLFAVELGIKDGIDPSEPMRSKAIERGVNALKGMAEQLPVPDEAYDYALMVTVDCFLRDVLQAFKEVCRILADGGVLVIAFIDRETPLGQIYEQKKQTSASYKQANFHSAQEIKKFLELSGFAVIEERQTVFSLDNQPQAVKPGTGEGVFGVIKAKKQAVQKGSIKK